MAHYAGLKRCKPIHKGDLDIHHDKFTQCKSRCGAMHFFIHHPNAKFLHAGPYHKTLVGTSNKA